MPGDGALTQYRVELSKLARRQFEKLPCETASRLVPVILSLGDEPRPPGTRKLSGREAWRLRAGNYRIVYEIHDAVLLVLVVQVGHRREVYR